MFSSGAAPEPHSARLRRLSPPVTRFKFLCSELRRIARVGAGPLRSRQVHLLVAMTALSTVLVGAALNQTASAASGVCSPHGENRYGEACLYGTNFHGVRATILSEALSVEHISTEHALNDLYIVNPSSTPPHFIEAGILYGSACENENFETGECYKKYETVSKNRRFFWGDLRPGTDYFAHFSKVASLGTAYQDEIHYVSPETWDISVGPDEGKSTKNPLAPTLIRTGTETTSTTAIACSEQYNLEWESTESLWHSGWTDAEEGAQLQQDEPPYAEWVNTDHWLRDRSSGIECFEKFSPATSAASGNTAGIQSLGTAELSEIAREFAASMGDSTPISSEYLTGDRRQVVLALSGDEVEDSGNVDAIILRGQFVDHLAPRPPGVTAPSGTVLTLVINAATGEMNDFGIQSNVPNVKEFGPVTLGD